MSHYSVTRLNIFVTFKRALRIKLGYLRVYRKCFGRSSGGDINFSGQHLLRVFGPAAENTSQLEDKSKLKSNHITADPENGLCC
jgi:hypothetical protein